MKSFTNVILPAFVYSVSAFAQHENTIKVSSPIEAVTVYMNGAEIKQSKQVDVKAGSNTIVFQKLSAYLQDQSVQVSVDGDAEVLSVTATSNYLNIEKMEPRVKLLKDSLALFTSKIASLNNQIDAYNSERALLNENRNIGNKQTPTSIQEIDKAADFYMQKTLEVNNAISKLNEQQTDLSTQYSLMQSQLQELNYKNNPERKEVTIVVHSSADKSIILHLRYIVDNAGWEPAYDLVATDVTKPITLKYKAKVYNNTGIKWDNVPLTLSTADPLQSATRPHLSAWTLNYSANSDDADDESAVNKEGLLNENNVGQTQSMMWRLDSTRTTVSKKSKQVTFKSVNVSELNTTFAIATPYTIPSDAKPYQVDITSYSLDAVYGYIAVPKLDRSAFLIAKVSGWEKLNLMDGPMNVYFNNAYIGQSSINTRFIEDTLELSLGRDNQILVTRAKKEDFGSKKLIGTSRKESYKYEIVVKNNKTVPVNIEIQDQLPVSQESDIVVDAEDISGAALDVPTGKLQWKTGLAAGAGTTYKLAFSVKYPKNKAVEVRRFRTINCPSF
ncbi:MAG TPA: DUF4139 domain-containing protein [Bacteroidia bacterium]|nr:DUF4139 domain-containing protein [Bacteroidia bacterium]